MKFSGIAYGVAFPRGQTKPRRRGRERWRFCRTLVTVGVKEARNPWAKGRRSPGQSHRQQLGQHSPLAPEGGLGLTWNHTWTESPTSFLASNTLQGVTASSQREPTPQDATSGKRYGVELERTTKVPTRSYNRVGFSAIGTHKRTMKSSHWVVTCVLQRLRSIFKKSGSSRIRYCCGCGIGWRL